MVVFSFLPSFKQNASYSAIGWSGSQIPHVKSWNFGFVRRWSHGRRAATCRDDSWRLVAVQTIALAWPLQWASIHIYTSYQA